MIKRAIIITLILNSIILIGIPSGHGYGIMILIEYLGVRNIIEYGFEFDKNYPYESSLFLIAIKQSNDGITIIAVIIKNIHQSPFNQSTKVPEEEANNVRPAVPIDASKAY